MEGQLEVTTEAQRHGEERSKKVYCLKQGGKMRFKILSIVSVIVLAVLFSWTNSSMSASNPSPSYGFDVSIVPDQQAPGVYVAQLQVSEVASARVIAAPAIRFRAGEPSTTTTAGDGMNFRFSVSVTQSGDAAEYDASVLNGKTVVSSSHGKISLKN